MYVRIWIRKSGGTKSERSNGSRTTKFGSGGPDQQKSGSGPAKSGATAGSCADRSESGSAESRGYTSAGWFEGRG